MRRKIILISLGCLLVVSCCFLFYIFWDGFYLPYKPCRPIKYPDKEVITSEANYTTPDPVESVLSFYDDTLQAQSPLEAGVGDWGKEQLTESLYLYSCYGVDINRLTTETGCILISNQEEQNKIRALLYLGEGSNQPCPRQFNAGISK